MTFRKTQFLLPILTAATLSLSACGEAASEPDDISPQDAFFAAFEPYCGKAFAGQLVSEDAADADFAGAEMVMHVRECSEDRIAIPFHVRTGEGWDRSRTWLITRTDTGLRLKHDHRHEDGESDVVTMYGGDTASEGTATTQDFPVDAESIALFEREGLSASVTNVWSVEVSASDSEVPSFAYQLRRTVEGGAPEDRFFRVEFDLSSAVPNPPAPWGWE